MRTASKFVGWGAAGIGLAIVMATLAGMFEAKIGAGPAEPGAHSQGASPAWLDASDIVEVRQITRPNHEIVIGTVRARNETVVSSRINANVTTVHVRAGDTVAAGTPLVSLDDRAIQARLAQFREGVTSAAAQLTEASSAARRIANLFERGSVARADRDSAEANLRLAQAELARAKQAVDEARTNLSYASISAPIAGRVIERYVDAGDTATLGAPLVRLYAPDRLRLEAQVRESLAVSMRRGQSLRAHIDATGAHFDAIVDEIVPSADAGSRTFLVKASLSIPGSEREAGTLYPGMSGRLAVPRAPRSLVVIPGEVVLRVGQLEQVYVATDLGFERRAIRLGAALDDGLVEVRSGLRAAERIAKLP